MLAAVLVVAVLVGSMALLIHAAHRAPGTLTGNSKTHTSTTPTATSTPPLQEGQAVYTSSGMFLAMPTVWSPDGARVATAIDRTTVESWDALTGNNVVKYSVAPDNEGTPGITTENVVSNVAWSPDGNTLAVCESQTIYLFDAKTAHLLRFFPTPTLAASNATTSPLMSSHVPLSGGNAFTNVVWSPDGTEIASAFNAGIYPNSQHTIYVWNATSGQVVKTISSNTNIPSVSWAPKGNLFAALVYQATDSTGSTAIVWNSATWAQVRTYPNVAALGWSPDGTQLALSTMNQSSTSSVVQIVDAHNGHQAQQFAVDGPVMEVHWSPDGTRLLVGAGTTLSIRSISTGKLLYTLPGYAYQGVWSPDSKYISSFTRNGIVIWVA